MQNTYYRSNEETEKYTLGKELMKNYMGTCLERNRHLEVNRLIAIHLILGNN